MHLNSFAVAECIVALSCIMAWYAINWSLLNIEWKLGNDDKRKLCLECFITLSCCLIALCMPLVLFILYCETKTEGNTLVFLSTWKDLETILINFFYCAYLSETAINKPL